MLSSGRDDRPAAKSIQFGAVWNKRETLASGLNPHISAPHSGEAPGGNSSSPFSSRRGQRSGSSHREQAKFSSFFFLLKHISVFGQYNKSSGPGIGYMLVSGGRGGGRTFGSLVQHGRDTEYVVLADVCHGRLDDTLAVLQTAVTLESLPAV